MGENQSADLGLPMKVVVFAATPVAVPCINMLLQQQRLAGVVMPHQVDEFSHQLQHWLELQGINHHRLPPEHHDETVTLLRRWEADVAISFGFAPSLPKPLCQTPRLGFYYFLGAAPQDYYGPMPEYWQIRDGSNQTRLTLLSAIADDNGADIAATLPIQIHPMDTLQCLENKLTQHSSLLVNDFLDTLIATQGKVTLQASNGQGKDAPVIDEADLHVYWPNMTAQQIVDCARAGNPRFGGCVVTLADKQLNLLQATVVKHPTYGVKPGTICHTGEPEGVIVATVDGALRLDVLSNMDGVFGGNHFISRFGIAAGMEFSSPGAKSQTKINTRGI